MKAFNSIKLKALSKKIATLGFVAALAIGCGKSDKNKVNSNQISNNPTSNPVSFGNNTQASSTWNNLKSQYSCSGGQNPYRMNDRVFTLQGSSFGNRIYGQMQPASSFSGTAGEAFFGHTMGTNDLYAITKVVNGNSVQYYVTVSFCSFSQNNIEMLGNNSSLSNFGIDVQLDTSINCQAGNILQGGISFSNQSLQQSGMNPQDGRSISLISGQCL
ncbi:MAG: hypothetical protein GY909_04375 [Oligoflexia bacterium]|nr:hypothetical protein [Oligoflexia bacterium]